MNSLDKMDEEWRLVIANGMACIYRGNTQLTSYMALETAKTIEDAIKFQSKHSTILENYNRLAKMCEKQTEEIEYLKAYIEGQNDSFAQMMEGRSAANATISMQAEALKAIADENSNHTIFTNCSSLHLAYEQLAREALSASAESVVAWESEHAAKVLEDAADSVEFDNDNPADDMVKDTLRRMAAEYRATNKEPK